MRAPFEVGTGLNDTGTYAVSDVWNFGIKPYWFDDDEQCWKYARRETWAKAPTKKAERKVKDLKGRTVADATEYELPSAKHGFANDARGFLRLLEMFEAVGIRGDGVR